MIQFRAWWPPLILLVILGGIWSFTEGPTPPQHYFVEEHSLVPHSTSQSASTLDASNWIDPSLPVSLTLRFQDEETPLTLLLRPSGWLDDTTIGIGSTERKLNARAHAWQGYAYFEGHVRPSPVSFVTVGDHASAHIVEPSGATLSITCHANSSMTKAWRTTGSQSQHCEISGEGIASIRALGELVHTTPLQASLEVAAQGGFEPGTGQLDRYVDPIPLAERYALSLKNLTLLIVMDKDSTGANDPDNLAIRASQRLASVANVATIYENQLGIRLRLQELLLIPDAPEFEDVGSQNLFPDFLNWLSVHRPQNNYGWTSAIKIGLGLVSQELGSAYIGSVGRSDSVGVIRRTAGWDTLAHELGHALGARHTAGGIMNSSANGGGNRSFFTASRFFAAPTAAQEIYTYARDRLGTIAPTLRNPNEMPFAINDFRQTPANTPVRFLPLQNDLASTPAGQINAALSLEELSQVTPSHAGTVRHEQDAVVFKPSQDYLGPAWFSYSLRGSVGNNQQGWLHKGDVSILVGEPKAAPFNLTLAPSQIFTFFPETPNGVLQQPKQAQIQWLSDAVGQLLIRVHSDATGSDAFAIGSQSYQISYRNPSTPKPEPAIYWQHPQQGTQRYHVGSQDIQPDPWIGDSTNGNQVRYFPGKDRLISAELLHPNKGTLEIVSLPSTSNGHSALLPTGELQFTPERNASGEVVIQLVLEDAAGSRREEAITIYLAGQAQTLVPIRAAVRYLIPDTNADANRWMLNAFDDRNWHLGAMPVGYEDGRGYEDVIETDVRRQMVNQNASIYLRIPFMIEDPGAFSRLILRARVDDGFIAYLNGKEVLRDSAPNNLNWSSRATSGREASTFLDFDISDARKQLFSGQNLLAIHGLNATNDSSDFLIMPELLALTSPALAFIESPKAASISITENTGIQFHSTLNTDHALPIVGDVTTSWQIVEAPKFASPIIEFSDNQAAVLFTHPGTYRVRLSAHDTSKIVTQEELVIRVGEAQDFDHVGDRIVAGPDITTDSTVVQLSGFQEPGTPGFEGDVIWKQISGPPGIVFTDPRELITTATLPSKGTYRLRLSSLTDSLTVFDDLTIRYQVSTQSLIGADSTAHFWIPNEPVSADWQQVDFNAIGWQQGLNGMGYDTFGTFDPDIQTNLQAQLQGRHSSLYIRYPFHLQPNQATSIEKLTLTLIADDGYVAYLNGREITRQNAPLTQINANSTAVQAADEDSFVKPPTIKLTEYTNLLQAGSNVLSVHGLNQRATSTDFLIKATLTATFPLSDSPPSTKTFQTWFADYPTLPENARLPNDDWDQDGLGNLLEFAMNTSPVTPDAQLAWNIETSEFSNIITIRHHQRSDLQALGGTILIESSPGLIADTWQPWTTQQVETLLLNDGLSQVSHKGPRTGGTQFFRLRIAFEL
jgi:hypothetical protein